MMTKWMAKGYLWLLLVLLYSPILIIMIFSFTEAKVLGNWTGFSTKLYSSLFTGGVQRSLVSALWNTFAIAMIAATVSTLLGSIAAIGIFNLRSRTRQVMNFAKRSDDECRYYYGRIPFPAVRKFWRFTRIHDGRAGAYHVLHALCGAECHATPEKDEPECL